MSDKQTTKVYLLVEVDIEHKSVPRPNAILSCKHAARVVLGDLMFNNTRTLEASLVDSDTKYHDPVLLPDDIKDILWRDSVKHLPLHERLKEAIKRDGEKPAIERWQALIDRGAINENGEVLLKSPWNKGESE